jgi:hypothetical protein
MSNEQNAKPRPRYRWPWFLLAGVLLGVVLAVIWLAAEVRRVKEQRQYDFVPANATNSASVPSAR